MKVERSNKPKMERTTELTALEWDVLKQAVKDWEPVGGTSFELRQAAMSLHHKLRSANDRQVIVLVHDRNK